MRREEITALGDLAGDAAAGLAGQIAELHKGIAGRVWRAVGPMALPVKIAHEGISRGAYSLARGITRTAVEAPWRAVSAIQSADAPSIEVTVAGRAVVGALNGAFGDTLVRSRNALAVPMTLRQGGRDVDCTAAGLRRAFPHATPRLVVFVHGLCQNDDAWRMGGRRHVPYGVRMQVELGYTPLYVRYNTGRHVSENGRELARLLEQVVERWPTEVHEVALVGHSMGGLVARSACHYGPDCEWCGKVRHVFTLGSPHLGAPLEQLANAASAGLAVLPETRGFAQALNIRSAGIKDLRYGYLVDECWIGEDCDAFLHNTSTDIPFLRTANHYFICATLTRDPDTLIARVIGDMLVLRASAWSNRGRGERMRFPIDQYQHLGGANHFDLLNHPAIYEQMRRWLAGRKALPVAAA
jgi:pimeloyl-ACP methyl ester carboxylesterase